MAERTCPRCGAAASVRLKFCRECGGRMEETPEPASPAPAPAGGGDETMVAGMKARSAPPPPPAPPSVPDLEEEDGEEDRDPGDETIMSGLGRTPAPGAAPGTGTRTFVGGLPAPPSPPGGTGDETIMSGFRMPSPAAPPKAEEDDRRSTETFVGTVPPGMADPVPPPPPVLRAPPPPPAPPPAPPEREEEPVTDDFDLGDDGDDASGATLLAPHPAPAPPRPAPAPPPPRGSEFRLEHWSPLVKGDVVRITGEEAVVGRDRGDIQYPGDNYLSKKHGRFHRDAEGRLCVEDLGTLNGTYLRVRTPVRLEHRDIISVGRHVFRFEVLKFEEKDDRTIEGDPLTRVQGVQGSAPRARLVKRQEEGFSGIPFFFGTHRYVLGRTDGSHRFTRDDQMSRRHVALEYRDGEYWLEDLGSQNGTWIRLRESHVLQPGDVVRMGDQYFKFA